MENSIKIDLTEVVSETVGWFWLRTGFSGGLV
jgi:hypothetical protein